MFQEQIRSLFLYVKPNPLTVSWCDFRVPVSGFLVSPPFSVGEVVLSPVLLLGG
jgi:hypothetical protein